MDTVEDLLKAKDLPAALLQTPDFIDVLGRLDSTSKVDFNPTSSVLGAIVSQEVVKLVTQRDFPSHGLAVYDSISQRCVF
jgi:hypothetical protein